MAFDLTKEELLNEYNEYVNNTYKTTPSSQAEKKMAVTVGDVLISVCSREEGDYSSYFYWKGRVKPVWGAIYKIHNSQLPEKSYEWTNAVTPDLTLRKMKTWAKVQKAKVTSFFFGLKFSITPDMTEEELQWAPWIALFNHGRKMEEIIAKKKIYFDATGHKNTWFAARDQDDDFMNGRRAERLGRMMQADITSSKQPLDLNMFWRTVAYTNKVYGQKFPEDERKVVDLLERYWVHGEKLATILGHVGVPQKRLADFSLPRSDEGR